ncbi:unnamed protein product [Ixodes persulcatus]
MSKQVLVLEPDSELHFKGPFNDVVTSYLKLSNPTDRRICFKVKTTAPKRYCVRPNSGILEPKQAVHVAVMLQPFEYDPSEKNKHKFMVQTMVAPDGDVNQDTVWRDANPEALMDSKLKCVFEMPAEAAPQNNLDVSTSHGDEKGAAPKTLTESAPKSPKASFFEADLKRVTEECRRLRDEVANLRQENAALKEDGLRRRMQNITSAPTASEAVTAHAAPETGSQPVHRAKEHSLAQPASISPLMLTLFALAMVVTGVLVGKWLF